MTDETVPFMLKDEVDRVHPVNDRARKRAEDAGLFPRRIRLALQCRASDRSDINERQADPVAWAQPARA